MPKSLLLTIDLEWYYDGGKKGDGNAADFEKMSLSQRYTSDHGQIEKSTITILKILKKYRQKITFFIVAEIDKVYPRIVKKIYEDGHEIAVHSYRHSELIGKKALGLDLKECLPFQKKYRVIGFRNPRIKVTKDQYSYLKKFLYKYDSSVYGTSKFDFCGTKIIPVSILPYVNKEIQKIPSPLNLKLFKQAVPFGSGMFVGSLQKIGKLFIDAYHKRYCQPPCIFLHSWQIEQPNYHKGYLLRNPFMFPYCIECKDLLECFCQKYKLLRIKDYLS